MSAQAATATPTEPAAATEGRWREPSGGERRRAAPHPGTPRRPERRRPGMPPPERPTGKSGAGARARPGPGSEAAAEAPTARAAAASEATATVRG